MGTISDKLAKLAQTKAAIRQAIINKGQDLPADTPFSQYPSKIAGISAGLSTNDATATAAEIYIGRTAYVKGSKLTGTANYIRGQSILVEHRTASFDGGVLVIPNITLSTMAFFCTTDPVQPAEGGPIELWGIKGSGISRFFGWTVLESASSGSYCLDYMDAAQVGDSVRIYVDPGYYTDAYGAIAVKVGVY